MLLGAMAVGGAASTLFAPQPKVPEPKAQQVPALPADAARDSGATVRAGVTDELEDKPLVGEDKKFTPTRKAGDVIGGLGAGGLRL